MIPWYIFRSHSEGPFQQHDIRVRVRIDNPKTFQDTKTIQDFPRLSMGQWLPPELWLFSGIQIPHPMDKTREPPMPLLEWYVSTAEGWKEVVYWENVRYVSCRLFQTISQEHGTTTRRISDWNQPSNKELTGHKELTGLFRCFNLFQFISEFQLKIK